MELALRSLARLTSQEKVYAVFRLCSLTESPTVFERGAGTPHRFPTPRSYFIFCGSSVVRTPGIQDAGVTGSTEGHG